jgi:hypothetical protein
LRGHAAELWAYLRHWGATKFDLKILALKRGALAFVIVLVGFFAAAVALATAVVLFLMGVVGGLTVALGGRAWLAQLVVAIGFLAFVFSVLLIARSRVLSRSRRATMDRYERKEHEQQLRFKRDMGDAAGQFFRDRVPAGARGAGEPGAASDGRRAEE